MQVGLSPQDLNLGYVMSGMKCRSDLDDSCLRANLANIGDQMQTLNET
jgi:hypothetical protein